VQDIEGDFVDFERLSRQLPGGFDLTQPLVEVFGLCRDCRQNPQPLRQPLLTTHKKNANKLKKETYARK
jgi:hypothetical protein